MALELYSPQPGSTVQNPVSVSWEYEPGSGNDLVFYNDGSTWTRLFDGEFQCTASQCTADIDLGAYGNKSITVWMNYDQTATVSFTTSETGTNPGDITVTVDTSALEAKVDELALVVTENQLYADVLTGLILSASFMFAAINGFSTGSQR